MKVDKKYIFEILLNNSFFIILQILYFIAGFLGIFNLFAQTGGLYAGLDKLLILQYIIIIIFFIFMCYRFFKINIKYTSAKFIYLYSSYLILFILYSAILYDFKTPLYSLTFLCLPDLNYGISSILKLWINKNEN